MNDFFNLLPVLSRQTTKTAYIACIKSHLQNVLQQINILQATSNGNILQLGQQFPTLMALVIDQNNTLYVLNGLTNGKFGKAQNLIQLGLGGFTSWQYSILP